MRFLLGSFLGLNQFNQLLVPDDAVLLAPGRQALGYLLPSVGQWSRIGLQGLLKYFLLIRRPHRRVGALFRQELLTWRFWDNISINNLSKKIQITATIYLRISRWLCFHPPSWCPALLSAMFFQMLSYSLLLLHLGLWIISNFK